MALEVRSTGPTQAPVGSGSQNWEVSGFGTPQAAIILMHNGGTADTDIAGALLSIGFYDGTRQRCGYCNMLDATAATGAHSSASVFTDRVGRVSWPGGDSRTVTSTAWSTNGISLTFDAGAARPYITVILIKGATGVYAGDYTPDTTVSNTVNATTTGINPNFIMNVGAYGSLVAGFAINSGSPLTQKSFGWSVSTNLSPCRNGSVLLSDRIGAAIVGGSASAFTYKEYEVTAFGTDQFTVTTQEGSSPSAFTTQQVFLALQVDALPDLFLATAPTGTGDWGPIYTATSQPVAALMIPCAQTAEDTYSDTGDESGGIGYYFVSPTEESGVYITNEDALTTTNASTRQSASLIIQGDEGGAPKFQASQPTFSSSGLTFADANTSSATAAYRILGVAFRDTSTSTAKRLMLLGVG